MGVYMRNNANTRSCNRFKIQQDMLRSATQTGEPLADILVRAGLTYDDLIYEKSMEKEWRGNRPYFLDDLREKDSHAPVVSFFSGCGGMDLGLEAAGYRHIALFEINEIFCKTIRCNRPKWKVFGPPTHHGDVSKFDEIEKTLRPLITAPFEGLFVGGPPCQPFSIAANQRFSKSGDNFKRVGFSHEKNGNLLFDFIRLVIEFRPKAFVIENVPGLRDLDGGEQLQTAIENLESAGYRVETPFVLDAAQYKIPQQRFRLFVVGSRGKGAFKHPTPFQELVGAGSVLTKKTPYTPNSETRQHKAESVLRYIMLNYGQRDQLGRVNRLDPTRPSKTVIAGGTSGGGRSHLHPEIPRTLSARECARLQTFPDEYVFVGASARQFTQVGNAVPPVLGAQIGTAILGSYF